MNKRTRPSAVTFIAARLPVEFAPAIHELDVARLVNEQGRQ